jgi:hypothetical protein
MMIMAADQLPAEPGLLADADLVTKHFRQALQMGWIGATWGGCGHRLTLSVGGFRRRILATLMA